MPAGHPAPPQAPAARNVPVLSESELQNAPQAGPQQSPSGLEKSGSWAEDGAGQEDDGESFNSLFSDAIAYTEL